MVTQSLWYVVLWDVKHSFLDKRGLPILVCWSNVDIYWTHI